MALTTGVDLELVENITDILLNEPLFYSKSIALIFSIEHNQY